jgi:hypothetical protein
MIGDYEDRKVDRYDDDKTGLMVSTCMVTDSDEPYETAIQHPNYNGNNIIVVEMYNNKKDAQTGHEKWVKTMTSENLPSQLKDEASSFTSKLYDISWGNDGWRAMERGNKED